MKILQIFGAVVAVHLLAFIVIFASPGCQSSPRNVPTPDATMPSAAAAPASPAPTYAEPPPTTVTTVAYNGDAAGGHVEPTRPGSPNAAALTPPPTPVENVAPVSTYTVQKGDSLWSIAKKNHLTISELTKANNLGAGATLQPGKKLIIPSKALTSAPSDLATAPATSHPESEKAATHQAGIETVKHTVIAGETLRSIAHKYGVKSGDLAAANGLTGPDKVHAGQVLTIPVAKASSKSANSKTGTKSAPPAATTAAANKSATPSDASLTPHFDLSPPPANQDLDSGLKTGTATDVPTIKVDDTTKTDDPNKK
ncbi:MAG TPA: LysM peptidoglycan-binding domain-containing protein [Candidatus Didemnitutus sp.]|nr:LysM peptidoglycan-binding domain-containing protein [Candidatus Didemnitutus sp.]